jgi:regulatory protein
MLITKIVKSRRQRNSYEIFIDDKPGLKVSEGTLASAALFTGKTLDERSIQKIVQTDTRERAHQMAVNFISYRPRSSKEIVDKLTRKGFTHELALEAIDRLKELNLLDDLQFARMFVRDKLLGKPMGKALLRRKLLEKGIAFQLSERVLKEYVTDENEQKAATTLAVRKLKLSRSRFSALDPLARQKRLVDYLLSRGFSQDIAYKTARSVIE